MNNLKTHLQQLHTALAQAPDTPRINFYIGNAHVGSIEESIAKRLFQAGFIVEDALLDGVALAGVDATARLNEMAFWLQSQDLAAKWRNEQLSVTDQAGVVHATIERAVVRVLGVKTFAVHLVGVRSDGAIWLQRRAMDKATDPGKLDTLVGGLVSAGEHWKEALTRETWEEAGIELKASTSSKSLLFGKPFEVRCPVDPKIQGYMIEQCAWYVVELPDGMVPQNQDGEVLEFVCLQKEELADEILKGQVAAQASVIFGKMIEEVDY